MNSVLGTFNTLIIKESTTHDLFSVILVDDSDLHRVKEISKFDCTKITNESPSNQITLSFL